MWILRVLKPLSEFNKKARSGDGRQSYCRGCNRARSRRYYQENHTHHLGVILAWKKQRKKELYARIAAVKAMNGCQLCPEADPVCLEFHHPVPGEKDFNVSNYFNVTWSWPGIVAEMIKCVVLCSNCHKKVHAGKLVVDPASRCRIDQG